MHQTKGDPIELTNRRVAAVLNSSSGGCDAECAAKMAAIIREHRIVLTSLDCVEGKDVKAALQKALADRTDVLIVLGGDGTIRTAGELCTQTETKLIPLPGGTMNMLPKALYGDGKWDEILRRTVAAPALVEVGGGEVGGNRFFCAGIFGSPALWADAREDVRKNRWLAAIETSIRVYHRTFSRNVRYRFDGGMRGRAVALSAICPLVSAAMTPNERALDMVILDHQGVGDALNLAWSAVFSDWRKDKNVTSLKADRVELSAGGRIPALLDGEKVTLPRAAEIRYLKACFRAIVPAN